ncbi:MAG: DUF2786 domain-containing protein [Bradymonadales bacterium]|nr:DUF2786 domain-containing protein [Bradymonadales bacterium]
MRKSAGNATIIPLEVQRLWIRWLHREWDAINTRYLAGRLKRPQILLDQAAGRDGSWNRTTRCLTISLPHVLRSLWAQVALTLRHEVAHQVVDELFGGAQASQHGPLFGRACRLLDLEGSPDLVRPPSAADQRVLERIRKLMNLAQSDNPHEAQLAMAAANRLLLRHNLEATEAVRSSPYVYRWFGKPVGQIPLERKLLSGILQDFFFVRNIWIQTTEMSTGRPVYLLEVLGMSHNVEIARYVHGYLTDTLDRLWNQYRTQQGPINRPKAMRNSYRVGVLQGFRQHLEAERESCRQEGLIWLGDASLKELFDQRHPVRDQCRSGTYLGGSANEDGQKAGRSLRIRSALVEPPASCRGLALPFRSEES